MSRQPASTGPNDGGTVSAFNRLLPIVLLLGTGIVLGISTTLAKMAAEAGIGAATFLTWSVAGATLVMLGVALVRRDPPPVNGRTLEYYAVAGVLSLAAPNLIYFAAVTHVGAGYVALSLAFPPLYTYLGALLLGMERFAFARAAGVVSALGGVAVLATYKFAEPSAPVGWIAAVLVAPAILAVGNLYRVIRWPVGATPAQLVPGMLAASVVILAVVAGFTPSIPLDAALHTPTAVALMVAQAATFAAFYYLFFVLLDLAGPVYVSFTGSVGAVAGTALAVFLLGEAPPGGLGIAVILTAVGITLVTRRR